MSDVSERRLAENEVYFREQNESIERGFEHIRNLTEQEGHTSFLHDGDAELHFYCECSDEACRLRVQVKASVYNQIHTRRDHFIVLPGHEVLEFERIVQKKLGYNVVQKKKMPPESTEQLKATDL